MNHLLTKYEADLVMSLGAFQCLIDNYPHNINRQWELAVTVKEYDVTGRYMRLSDHLCNVRLRVIHAL